ncbi:hypothetical protein ACKUV4_015260 [Acinetobacter baumannii]
MAQGSNAKLTALIGKFKSKDGAINTANTASSDAATAKTNAATALVKLKLLLMLLVPMHHLLMKSMLL